MFTYWSVIKCFISFVPQVSYFVTKENGFFDISLYLNNMQSISKQIKDVLNATLNLLFISLQICCAPLMPFNFLFLVCPLGKYMKHKKRLRHDRDTFNFNVLKYLAPPWCTNKLYFSLFFKSCFLHLEENSRLRRW